MGHEFGFSHAGFGFFVINPDIRSSVRATGAIAVTDGVNGISKGQPLPVDEKGCRSQIP